MTRLDALLVCAALASSGCGGSSPAGEKERKALAADNDRAAPTLPASELPESIPANTSISYRIDVEAEHIDQLKLTPDESEHTSARGRRHVSITYTAPKTVLNDVYGTLRAQACDQARSRVERAPSRGGTILQLRAGGVRNVINDRDKFFPAPEWTDAYKACATALDAAFPTRGGAPAAQLQLEFSEKLSHGVNVSADVGPDLLGISWDEEERVATIDIATIRPVEVSIRSGKASERTLVDLKTHSGLKIELAEGPRVLTVETLAGPAKQVGGDVPAGVDARSTRAKSSAGQAPSASAPEATGAVPKTDAPSAPAEAAQRPAKAPKAPAPTPNPPPKPPAKP